MEGKDDSTELWQHIILLYSTDWSKMVLLIRSQICWRYFCHRFPAETKNAKYRFLVKFIFCLSNIFRGF